MENNSTTTDAWPQISVQVPGPDGSEPVVDYPFLYMEDPKDAALLKALNRVQPFRGAPSRAPGKWRKTLEAMYLEKDEQGQPVFPNRTVTVEFIQHRFQQYIDSREAMRSAACFISRFEDLYDLIEHDGDKGDMDRWAWACMQPNWG